MGTVDTAYLHFLAFCVILLLFLKVYISFLLLFLIIIYKVSWRQLNFCLVHKFQNTEKGWKKEDTPQRCCTWCSCSTWAWGWGVCSWLSVRCWWFHCDRWEHWKILNVGNDVYVWVLGSQMVATVGPGHSPGSRLFFLRSKRIFSRDDISQPALQLRVVVWQNSGQWDARRTMTFSQDCVDTHSAPFLLCFSILYSELRHAG